MNKIIFITLVVTTFINHSSPALRNYTMKKFCRKNYFIVFLQRPILKFARRIHQSLQNASKIRWNRWEVLWNLENLHLESQLNVRITTMLNSSWFLFLATNVQRIFPALDPLQIGDIAVNNGFDMKLFKLRVYGTSNFKIEKIRVVLDKNI